MPPRKRERAPDLWMIEKLQYAFATASELLCYGRQDLKNAAMAGAVDTLLIALEPPDGGVRKAVPRLRRRADRRERTRVVLHV